MRRDSLYFRCCTAPRSSPEYDDRRCEADLDNLWIPILELTQQLYRAFCLPHILCGIPLSVNSEVASV